MQKNPGTVIQHISGKEKDLFVNLLLLTTPKFVELRANIKNIFVMATLSTYPENAIFSSKELERKVQEFTLCKIKRGIITQTIEDFIKNGDIEFIEIDQYKIKKKIIENDYSVYRNEIWKEFEPILKRSIRDYDSYFNTTIQEIIENILQDYLILINETIEELENNQIEQLFASEKNLKSLIKINVEKRFITDQISTKLPELIEGYFNTKSTIFNEFISQCYSGAIILYVLTKERELPSVSLKEHLHCLIVDTDFLVNLLCLTSSKFPMIDVVTRNCVKNMIPIYFLGVTRNELNSLINAMGIKYDQISSSVKSETEKISEIQKSQILQDFNNRNTKDNSLTWPKYFTYLQSWEEIVAKDHGIFILPETEQFELDTSVMDYMRNAIPFIETKFLGKDDPSTEKMFIKTKSPNQLDHDIYCMGVVSGLKNQQFKKNHLKVTGASELHGPYFLTFDNTLAYANKLYSMNQHAKPLVIQPRTLLNYIIKFSHVDINTSHKKDVGKAILRYSLMRSDLKISLGDFIDALIKQREIVDKKDKDFIINCILSSALKDDLDKMLQAGEISQAEREIQKIFPELFLQLEEKKLLEARNKELAQELAKGHEIIKQREREIEELQKRINELDNRKGKESSEILRK